MVEYSTSLDMIFSSLADATRRDILRRVSKKELSISELARPYAEEMSFAAVAKHVSVLTTARLIRRRKEGRQQIITMEPKAVSLALTYLEKYEKTWETRFTQLDKILKA